MSQIFDLHFQNLFLVSNFIIINSISCSSRKSCFNRTLNFETCNHAEGASSNNSLRHLFQIKHERDNNVDGEIHKFCKKCVENRHNTCAVMSIEEEDSLNTNNNNVAIANKGHVTIYNEKDPSKAQMHRHYSVTMKVKQKQLGKI